MAFHEAVPGHHFQLTIAQEIEGNHLVHSVFGDVATAEGWGLYSERLADEMGLYSGAVARLGMVSTDAWRAARLVLDTGLHALGWSRQAAIDWMTANVPMSPVEVASEVDRYIAVPGQALAYMVGRLELESYRRRATERLGDASTCGRSTTSCWLRPGAPARAVRGRGPLDQCPTGQSVGSATWTN